jgi:hypothetical protein
LVKTDSKGELLTRLSMSQGVSPRAEEADPPQLVDVAEPSVGRQFYRSVSKDSNREGPEPDRIKTKKIQTRVLRHPVSFSRNRSSFLLLSSS